MIRLLRNEIEKWLKRGEFSRADLGFWGLVCFGIGVAFMTVACVIAQARRRKRCSDDGHV
ncbi:MAG: hypothetical protein JSV79_07465 [Armatimonadota bacterium]|nr:MAG: hypothetical protein JSV79_07465 [Armatimonadota bacterium]